jgi:PhzF family phenazine biosynthesis protein
MTAIAVRFGVYLVEAFVAGPGSGNPAAVVPLTQPLDDDWLQSTAAELALPATAYVWPEARDRFRLRWFTPSIELPSCGHGTLAAAHVVFEQEPGANSVEFATSLGILPANLDADGSVEFRMPGQRLERWELPARAVDALGVTPVEVRRSPRHCLIRLHSEADVRALEPDLRVLADLPVVGIAVTAPGAPPYDVVSRWFVPGERIEDQVTGTAHTLIGPYWASVTGRRQFSAYQASARGGELRVSVDDEGVLLAGRALTVVRGFLPPELRPAVVGHLAGPDAVTP